MDFNAVIAQTMFSTAAGTWVEDRVRCELGQIVPRIEPVHPVDVCPLADMGEFILRTIQMLSHFANVIALGPFVDEQASSRLQTLLDDDDGSGSDYLDEMHETLKALAAELNTASNTCLRLWRESPEPVPIPLTRPSQPVRQYDIQPSSHLRPNLSPSPNMSQWPNAPSPSSDGARLIDTLKERGSGLYTCPYGRDCDKGGVCDDGSLQVFKRNCHFRAHLLRHEKSFKCDLPGCRNTKGFARLDQLIRHKREVRH